MSRSRLSFQGPNESRIYHLKGLLSFFLGSSGLPDEEPRRLPQPANNRCCRCMRFDMVTMVLILYLYGQISFHEKRDIVLGIIIMFLIALGKIGRKR